MADLLETLGLLSPDVMLDVVRTLFGGEDLDGHLRQSSFPCEVVLVIIPIGRHLFDILVTVENVERFGNFLTPAPPDSVGKDSNVLYQHERLTKDDPLVKIHGEATAVRRTLAAYEEAVLSCFKQGETWLNGEISYLRKPQHRQGWGASRLK